MDQFEIESALQTFRIIVDTREHLTTCLKKRCESFGVQYERKTLSYGDYAADIVLPNGERLLDFSDAAKPKTVIERKQSLDELAACFTRGRDRFRREFERASSNNAKVYLLIENGSWESIMNHRYRSKYHPQAYKASLTAWMVRYGITPVFCKTESSGMLIKEILYRDMKERLERGEYG